MLSYIQKYCLERSKEKLYVSNQKSHSSVSSTKTSIFNTSEPFIVDEQKVKPHLPHKHCHGAQDSNHIILYPITLEQFLLQKSNK